MLFNSFQFLLFFPIVTVLYYLLPHKLRWLLLLAASCIFYMFFVPVYIFILLATILVDYVAGIMIEKAAGPRRKALLVASIVANAGTLCFFKYYNFFAGNINGLMHAAHMAYAIPLIKILLPIGLSFHTFQAMSYTIEVYRGNQKAEKHLGIYALYVLFYPQLIAGPIERPQNMMPQFHRRQTFDYARVVSGLRMMAWGLFKKAVIADRIAMLTDPVYNDTHSYSATTLLITSVLFAYEIYCDFSGYSDIALGAAKVMGFELMANFNLPFRSRSVTEFWRRWHISLSTWFYDYLFNPMMTVLRSRGRAALIFCLLFTFFVSGIWHGAGWHYILFGLLQGIAIIYEHFTKKKRRKIFAGIPEAVNNTLSRLLTMGYLVLTWIFFRAGNATTAVYIVKRLPYTVAELYHHLLHRKQANGNAIININLQHLMTCVYWIIFLEVVQHFWGNDAADRFIINKPRMVRWAMYGLLVFTIYIFGIFDNRQFIYFQF